MRQVVHLSVVWAIGVGANAARECEQKRRRKRPPMGGRTGAAPYRPSFFRPPFCIIGGVQGFGFCSEAGNKVVSKLKQARIGAKSTVDLLTLGRKSPFRPRYAKPG